jgi:hypothetical protein
MQDNTWLPVKNENSKWAVGNEATKSERFKYNMTVLWIIVQENDAVLKAISKVRFTSFGCKLHWRSKRAIIKVHAWIFVWNYDERKKAEAQKQNLCCMH